MSAAAEWGARLLAMPRVELATLPTPLTEAVGLRDALGGTRACPRILLKRDDLTGFAMGGNKARKLEYLLADARREGATAVITTGAVQSNHARMTVAAARVAKLDPILVLTAEESEPKLQGNFLLDRLFGATIHVVYSNGDSRATTLEEQARVEEVSHDVVRHGGHPYVIPVGGSSGVGVLGYVAATCELVEQLKAIGVSPSRLYYASGSRGTQAGLELGARLAEAPYELYGVAVSGGESVKRDRAAGLMSDAAALLETKVTFSPGELRTEQDHIGDGYGIPTPEGLEAIRLLACGDGILLDPVYTSKAMAALIADVRAGIISPEETVVFLHSGGAPALFAYTDALKPITCVKRVQRNGQSRQPVTAVKT